MIFANEKSFAQATFIIKLNAASLILIINNCFKLNECPSNQQKYQREFQKLFNALLFLKIKSLSLFSVVVEISSSTTCLFFSLNQFFEKERFR